MKHKHFIEINGSILTESFDINKNGVILDLITPSGVYYIEFNNQHKVTEHTKWL